MGFSSSRTLDPAGGHDPKMELAQALNSQMIRLEKKKQKTMDQTNNQKVSQICTKDNGNVISTCNSDFYSTGCKK